MAKATKRRRARQGAKSSSGAAHTAGDIPIEQGATLLRRGERESIEDPLEDFADDECTRDAWLLERQAEDIQRDGP
jgi:hypothetical protein